MYFSFVCRTKGREPRQGGKEKTTVQRHQSQKPPPVLQQRRSERPKTAGFETCLLKQARTVSALFSVSGLPLVGKTEADMNKRAAAFASEQPRKGRSMAPDALRPFRGVKRATQTIREAQPLFLFRSAGISRSFEPAKESGVRARAGQNGTIKTLRTKNKIK